AAVEDVTAWCLLTVVLAVARGDGLGGPALTVALAAVFSVAMLKAVGPLAAAFFENRRAAAPEASPVGRASLAWAVGLAFASALVTEAIGIHALFGAFIAGV